MANRNLKAKADKAARQRREFAHLEYSKAGYQTARPFESDHGPINFVPAKQVKPREEYFDRKKYVAQRVQGLNPGKPHRVPAKVTRSTALMAAWVNDGEVRIVRGPKGR